MTDQAVLYDLVNAIDRQTKVLESLVAAVLLDPCRGRCEPDEVSRAVARAKVLRERTSPDGPRERS